MRCITPALLAALALQGCATSTTPSKSAVQSGEPVRYPIERRASASHQEKRLAGAAYRARGYRHTLQYGQRRYSVGDGGAVSEVSDAEGDAVSSERLAGAPASTASGTNDGDRARELWERYCDAGREMSADDYTELQRLRADYPMPADLADSCSPPK